MFYQFLFRWPLTALLAAALVLCVAGGTPRAASLSAPSCATPVLDSKIGQMIMVGFPGDGEKDPGVIAVRDQLAKGLIGGVVLFPENIASPKQLQDLIAYLRNARSMPMPFIAVDQEGGKVQRLNRWNGHSNFRRPSASPALRATPRRRQPKSFMPRWRKNLPRQAST